MSAGSLAGHAISDFTQPWGLEPSVARLAVQVAEYSLKLAVDWWDLAAVAVRGKVATGATHITP